MTDTQSAFPHTAGAPLPEWLTFGIRYLGVASGLLAIVFVINNFLIFGFGLPGPWRMMTGSESSGLGIAQCALVLAAILYPAWQARSGGSLRIDSARLNSIAEYLIRLAFWSVFFIGIADAIISFLRVEDIHKVLFGSDIATSLGLSNLRGTYVHIPLMLVGAVIAARERSISIVWLALLVVIAELLIVLARFVFAYEQTFMGDLVRFWYAALFLFASAYTLKEDAHVRVDVFYANFTRRTRSILNVTGTLAFGLPLCWLILLRGMWEKTSLINSPMLNFETSMSGFGMYVKYLMAAFLIVFALSMLFQFTATLFSALADIDENVEDHPAQDTGVEGLS